MPNPIARWHREHAKFAQLLGLLEREVGAFHRGDPPNYELVADILFYLQHYADCIHHRREDVAFGRLVERDPALRPTVDLLLQEHRLIAQAGGALLEQLDEATGDVMAPRTDLESAAASFLLCYRKHLAREEREVIPRAQELLTAEDWAGVAATVPATADPLFGAEVETRFRALRRQIDREAAVSL